MPSNYYAEGEHNVICERTGFKIKSSDAVKEWDGTIVRKESFEARHPQDLIRSRQDQPGVKNSRPRPDDNFVSTNEVTKASL